MSIDTIRRTFPGAPLGSYVCEEGWLVVGDQAWTADEWGSRDSCHRSGRGIGAGRPVMFDDPRHRKDREAKRQRRARARLGVAS